MVPVPLPVRAVPVPQPVPVDRVRVLRAPVRRVREHRDPLVVPAATVLLRA